MSTADLILPDLKTVLRRLKLSPILDTLPERLALARQQKMAHLDFLLLVLADEVTRRGGLATSLRVQRARLDPTMQRSCALAASASGWTAAIGTLSLTSPEGISVHAALRDT